MIVNREIAKVFSVGSLPAADLSRNTATRIRALNSRKQKWVVANSNFSKSLGTQEYCDRVWENTLIFRAFVISRFKSRNGFCCVESVIKVLQAPNDQTVARQRNILKGVIA